MENNNVKYQSSTFIGFVMLLAGATVTINFFKCVAVMGQVAGDLGIGNPGMLMTIFTIVGVILAFPTAMFIDKIGPLKMFAVALICVAVGSVIGSFASNGSIMLVSRAIEGIGYIFASIAGPGTLGVYVNPKDMGLANGIWCTWMPVGQIIAVNLTTALNGGGMGWKKIWIIYAILPVIFIFIVNALLKKPQGLPAADAAAPTKGQNFISKLCSNKTYIFGIIAMMVFNYLVIQIGTYLQPLGLSIGMSDTEAAFANTWPMVVALVGCTVGGKLCDILGPKKTLIVCYIGAAAGFLIAFSGSRMAIYVGGFIFGLIGMGCPGAFLGSVAKFVGPEYAIYGTAGFFFLGYIGQSAATMIWEWLFKMGGGNYFKAVSIVVIPASIITLILLFLGDFDSKKSQA